MSSSSSWRNTEVGKGYQAKGVIRQPGVENVAVFIKNMSVPAQESLSSQEGQGTPKDHKKEEKKSKKHKKEKSRKASKHSKHKSSHSLRDNDRSSNSLVGFNPLLQLLASRLSDNTLVLTSAAPRK